MASETILLIADYEGCHFEILEDQAAGFYVFRFEGDEKVSTHDYLQDNLKMAKRCAYKQWGVPKSAWFQASKEKSRLL